MHRRFWLSIAMLAAGASLLVAAGLASAGTSRSHAPAKTDAFKKGGTFRVASTSDVDSIDPAIAYGTTSWNFEYVTEARLFNYPDKAGAAGKRLVPEGASGVTISKGGKVYTFTIAKGFKFSNGKPVTASSYRWAIARALNKDLQSPAAQFITDKAGANIKGAAAVNAGSGGPYPSGVKVKGNKLVITLTAPDPSFMSKITMPFFGAADTSMPLTTEITTVDSGHPVPGSGPYYVQARTPRQTIDLKRNPNYKGKRPHYISALHYTRVPNISTCENLVTSNQVERGCLAPANVAGVAQKYGINKSRFWVKPRVCTSYFALNTSRPLFKGNAKLRQAINNVINRKQLNDQNGPYSGGTWDKILPPNMPGANAVHPYAKALKSPQVATAKKLAKGHTKSGKLNYWFFSDSPASQLQMELNRTALKKIGLTIQPKGFIGFDLYTHAGKKGATFDMTSAGWCQDYPDPYDFINILLYGGNIQADNNNNLAYFNNKTYNSKMLAASKLGGTKRLTNYGKLDVDIMGNQAPWASTAIINLRIYLGNKVNPKSLLFQPIYSDIDYAAVALK